MKSRGRKLSFPSGRRICRLGTLPLLTYAVLGAGTVAQWAGRPAWALMIASPEGQSGNGNTTDMNGASPIFGFDNVISVGGASGVYLGNGWVLTAAHVGPGSTSLPGGSYTPLNQTYFQMLYNGGQVADLIAFRVQADPTSGLPLLPGLPLAQSTPSVYATVTVAGTGFTSFSPNYWDNSWNDLGSNATGQTATYGGYTYGVSGIKRWGTDSIWGLGPYSNTYGTQVGTQTQFYTGLNTGTNPATSAGTQSSMAQVTSGDSGGGMFANNRLTGILDSRGSPYTSTPGNATFYGDYNFGIDVHTYAMQLDAATLTSEWTYIGSSAQTWTTSTDWNKANGNLVPTGPGSSANFLGAITAPQNITVGSPLTLGCMTFSNNNSVTLTGSTITLDNTTNTYNNGQGSATGSVAIPSQLTVTAGTHTIANALTIAGSGTLYLGITGTTSNLTLSGNISSTAAPGTITKTGTGTATLSGTNSYSGGTTVNAGVLVFANPASVPTSGPLTINAAGTVAFNFTGVQTILSRITGTSAGTVALTAASAAENINFSSSGANLTAASLGAVGSLTYTGTFTPNASTYRLGGGGGTLTYPNTITGSYNVLIAGAAGSTVALTAANTYSGSTTLQSGELTIASDAAIAGPTSTVNFNGGILGITGTTLTNFNDHTINSATFTGGFDIATALNNFTLSQNLGTGGGTGSMTKLGAGTMTLTGSNAYTGTTTLYAGTLIAASDHALGTGTVTLAPASATATLSLLTPNPSIGSLTSSGAGTSKVILGSTAGPVNTILTVGTDNTSPGISLTNGVSYGAVTPFSGIISQAAGTTASLAKVGSGTLALAGTNTYTGTTTISAGALQTVDAAGLPAASLLLLDGGVFQSTSTTSAAFTRSLGTTGSNKFQWTTNGGGFSANGGPLTVNIGNSPTPQTLTWGTTVGTNLIGPLNFGSTTANAQTILQNPINLNAAPRTINVTPGLGGDSALLSGAISSSPPGGSLVKTGNGLLVLTATNTYTGGTTLNAGELSIANDANIGGPTTPLTFSGGILQLTNSAVTNLNAHTVNWATFNGGFDIVSANLSITQNIGNAAPNGGSLTKLGTGTLTLYAGNSYSAGTTVSEGTLVAANDNALGTGRLALQVPYNFATIDFTTPNPSIGSLTSSSANYLSGPSATLLLGTAVNGSNPAINTNLTIGTDNTTPAYPYVGLISQVTGTIGSITKVGTGTLTLQPYFPGGTTTTNTYTGGTTINAGTLVFQGAPAVPNSGSILVNPNATVAFDFGVAQSILNRISPASTGTVAVTAGSATNNIDFSTAGANLNAVFLGAVGSVTYTGTLTPNGSVYRFGGGGTLTYTTPITGSSSVLIGGAAGTTLTLQPTLPDGTPTTNSYTGGTTINAGTLVVKSSANLGAPTGALTINNATLDVLTGFAETRTITLGTGSPTIAVNTGIYTLTTAPAGTGTLTKTGPGTLQILAAPSSNALLKFTGLTVSAGKLDLTNHDLWIPNGASALSALQGKIITSTPGPTTLGPTTVALALLTESDYQAVTGTNVLDSQTIGPNDLVGRFTYKGDANLDGKITVDDYLALNLGYLFGLKGWTHGDFEQTGTITPADYADIDTNYLHQSGPAADGMIALHTSWFGPAYTNAFNALNGFAPVPEPASLALLATAALALSRRRTPRHS